jgi:hypothetical protein
MRICQFEHVVGHLGTHGMKCSQGLVNSLLAVNCYTGEQLCFELIGRYHMRSAYTYIHTYIYAYIY